jgi:hypothetical protein
VLLAELNIRHTRRHMPTRRVALDDSYLPTSGARFGAVLLGAVVAEHLSGLDEEQFDALDRLVDTARRGLTVPRLALRYRLQTDTHGLDRSRHRIVGPDVERGRLLPVLELDRHGPPAPQVLGAVMAAAWLPAAGRRPAFSAIDAARARPGELPEGLEVRRLFHGLPAAAPPEPGARARVGAGFAEWRGVPSEQRWAMEVLGLRPCMGVERDDVQRRFRRLVRLAHPDHGAGSDGAAERIAELAEAREVLLDGVADRPDAAVGSDGDIASAGGRSAG